MTFRTHIDRAGTFPVVQIPCHHYSEPVNLNSARAGVLHTTEGGWDGSIQEFRVKYAPHFAVGLKHGIPTIAQLIPVGIMGAATRGHNNMAIVQIEMIGFSKETPWLPDPQTLAVLASLMNVCKQEWGIPLSHPWPDGDYGRYGHNPHRVSGKLGAVAGWYGHGDMPDPDVHWDPGNLSWSKVFAKCHELSPSA